MTLRLLLVLIAILCISIAAVLGFGWVDNSLLEAGDYGGWLAASLLAYFISGEVDQ